MNKKKLLALLMALVMTLSLIPTTVWADDEPALTGYFTYEGLSSDSNSGIKLSNGAAVEISDDATYRNVYLKMHFTSNGEEFTPSFEVVTNLFWFGGTTATAVNGETSWVSDVFDLYISGQSGTVTVKLNAKIGGETITLSTNTIYINTEPPTPEVPADPIEGYDAEGGTLIDTYDTLEAAIAAEGVQYVKLTADISESDIGLYTKDLTLDLNGQTVDATNAKSLFMSVSGGRTLTIKDSSEAGNGTLTGAGRGTGGMFLVTNDAAVVLDSGKIVFTSPNPDEDIVFGGFDGKFTAQINGGSVTANCALADGFQSAVSISGGKIEAKGFEGWAASMGYGISYNITGGSFKGMNTTATAIDGKAVAAGYKVVEDTVLGSGWYKVVSDVPNVAKIVETDTPYATLQAAINAAQAGETIELLRNNDLGTTGVTVAKGKTVVLDLAGYDIFGEFDGKLITNNGTLTINNTTQTIGHVYNKDISAQGHDPVYNTGTLTVNNGIFGDSDSDQTNDNHISRGIAIRNDCGTVTINGGYFTAGDNYLNTGWAYSVGNVNGGSMTINNATVYGKNNGNLFSTGGTLTVKGGSFTIDGTNSHYCLYTSGEGAKIVVEGGTFHKGEQVTGGNDYLVYASTGSSIEIKGGMFSTAETIYGDNNYKVSITGGLFNIDPSVSTPKYIAPGYKVIPNTNEDYPYTIGVDNTAFEEVKDTVNKEVTNTNTNTNTAFSFATATTENTDDVTYAIKTTTNNTQVAYTPVQTDVVAKPAVSQNAANDSSVKNTTVVNGVKTAVETYAATRTTEIQAKKGDDEVDLLTTQAAAKAITKAAAAYTGEANDIAKVEIQLQTELTSYTLADKDESVVTTALIYQVTPQAVLLDASGVQLGEAQTLTNIDLAAQGLTLKFQLPVPDSAVTDSGKVIVTHHSDDSTYADSTSVLEVQQDDAGNHYVVIETTHFSEFELKPYVVAGTNELISASLTLGGSIDLNFYLKLQDDVTAVRFTFNGATTTVPVTASSYDSANGRYKFSIPVAAKDIYKDVTIELLNANGDTQGFCLTDYPNDVDNYYTYSVVDYLDDVIAYDGSTDTVKALARSLGTYGYYANLHLLKGETHPIYNTVSNSDDGIIINYKDGRNTEGSNPISGSGMTLLLRSETVIAYRFGYNEGESDYSGYKFYFTHSYTYDDGGYAKNEEYEVYPVHTGNYWYVESKGIPATYLNQGVTFKIVSGDNVAEYSTTYSPMIYGGSMLNKATTSDTLKNTIRAMYDYNQKAIAYFNSLQ